MYNGARANAGLSVVFSLGGSVQHDTRGRRSPWLHPPTPHFLSHPHTHPMAPGHALAWNVALTCSQGAAVV
eukprot:10354285-Alexandrium_andersonii.AAC.1